MEDEKALESLATALGKARAKHRNIVSIHEALGVIREEYLEVEQEIFTQQFDRHACHTELLHLAAMAIRAITDLGLEHA